MITFQTETVDQIWPDMGPLIAEHWRALARNQDLVPLDVDIDMYRAIERAGRLMVAAVRNDGALCGYAVYMVTFHPHYRTTLFANADLFWVTPDRRGAGVGMRMFRFVEEQLRGMGVKVMNTYYKTAHPEAERLLEALGHEKIEAVFQKVLV
jgi:GNAT superfamily N-acetyltransferase